MAFSESARRRRAGSGRPQRPAGLNEHLLFVIRGEIEEPDPEPLFWRAGLPSWSPC